MRRYGKDGRAHARVFNVRLGNLDQIESDVTEQWKKTLESDISGALKSFTRKDPACGQISCGTDLSKGGRERESLGGRGFLNIDIKITKYCNRVYRCLWKTESDVKVFKDRTWTTQRPSEEAHEEERPLTTWLPRRGRGLKREELNSKWRRKRTKQDGGLSSILLICRHREKFSLKEERMSNDWVRMGSLRIMDVC